MKKGVRGILMRAWRPLAAVGAGVMLALSMPPWNLGELVWVWTVPLLVAVWSLSDSPRPRYHGKLRWRRLASHWFGRRPRFWGGIKLGFLSGLTFFTINLFWIFELHPVIDSKALALLGVLALASYLALYLAAWGGIAATLGRPSVDELSIPVTEPVLDESPEDERNRKKKEALGKLDKKPGLFTTSFASLKFAFINAGAWVTLEWIRGWFLSGFGWNGLGIALHENPTLIQICDLVGVTGLAFLPVFLSCILINTAWRVHLEAGSKRLRPHLDFMLAVVLLILVFFYGVQKATEPLPEEAIEVRTLLVQPNIPQTLKWDPEAARNIYRTLKDLTSIYVGVQELDLVVWPEACLPLALDHPEHVRFLGPLLAAGEGEHSMLIGCNVIKEEPGEERQFYNSAALLKGAVGNSPQIYDKSHLVPFGEFLPLRSFPLVDRMLGGLLPNDMSRGTSNEPLRLSLVERPGEVIEDEDGSQRVSGAREAQSVALSALVCFEDTVPRLVRKMVRPEPQLFVNVTNDGWFGKSVASEQHLINAMFRCIEFRRPMVRCANTGVSVCLDQTGSLFDREEGDGYARRVEDPETENTFVAGALPSVIRLHPDPPTTFYARYGDLFTCLCAGFTSLAVVWRLLRGRLGRKGDK